MSMKSRLIRSLALLAIFVAVLIPIVSAQSAKSGLAPDAVKYFSGHDTVQPATALGQKAIWRMILRGAPLVRPFATYPRGANWLAAKPAIRIAAAQASGYHPFVKPFLITDDDWSGGAGNWNSTNWSLGSAPGSSNNAVINNSTPAAVVQLNVSDTINNLTVGSTSVLNFQNNNSLTVAGTTITNSDSTGTGGITLSSAGNFTNLILGSSAVTLTGGGTVTLGNNSNNRIYGAVAADVLTNANNIIQGSGQIGADQMGLVNQGTINANQATPLTVWTSNGTTNTGTLEATAGGNLILQNDTFTNTGGTILASGTNSVVSLFNSTINGGTLNTASGGLIQADGTPTLIGVTNKGTYQLPNNNSTTIEGTITNSGAIQLNSIGNLTNLVLGGAGVTLTGGGTITLDNNSENRIYGAAGTDVLTNVNNTIQGSGQIGAGQMGLVNQAIIDANQPTALTIQTSNGTTNTGTLEASAGGNLILDADTYTNTGGTILASGAGSVVTLLNPTINGGTLNTASGGLIQASGDPDAQWRHQQGHLPVAQ